MARKADAAQEAPIAAAPLPYITTSLADHWSRDIASFWNRVATAQDPMEFWRAEWALDVDLFRDSMQAWADLWTLPIRILSQAIDAPRQDDAAAAGDLKPVPLPE